MERYLGPFSDHVYALMRIVVGFLFWCHGAQKLFGWLGGTPVELLSLRGAAGVIEFFGGALIALGVYSGWAAFVCSGQMAVAYFLAHQPRGLLPIENRGELAALYAWVFLLMATRGAGRWSLLPGKGAGAPES